MARVPYLDKADLAPDNQDLLARNIALFRALAHSPNGLRAFVEPEYRRYLEEFPLPCRRPGASLMADAGKSFAAARPAATAVILRDGRAGLEVFMVVRHQEIDFASGALVFPGGKVDAQDEDPASADFAPSAADVPGRAFLVAAAREAFEEAGLVLAGRMGERDLLDAEAAHRLVGTYRARLADGNISFLDVVRGENLRLAADLMVPFAHWITPQTQPKRFDTHFLLVAAPVEQLGAHDGGKFVEGFWIAPAVALREAEVGTRTLLFPTHMNLLKLAQFADVAEAVAAARQAPIVSVMPRVERTATGRTLHIPAAAGYGITEWVVPSPKRLG